MHSFKELSELFEQHFTGRQFPEQPEQLYNAAQYILSIGGKRIRPILVLMGNELFDELHPEALAVAQAIELFHNFTLIHDDIMDKAPLRRGKATVHKVYGDSTALLAGDVVLVQAYEQLAKVRHANLQSLLLLFNKTAREVCEGQQMDMDFEQKDVVETEEYTQMIALKTSVLLAGSLQMGAIIGGAGLGNQQHLYEFGKNLGIAFQVQDDYLDVFGDPLKFGKQPGGDIIANKKTFLQIHAMAHATGNDKEALNYWMKQQPEHPAEKITAVTEIFRRTGADAWASSLKEQYYRMALEHLEAIAVVSARKSELRNLAEFLMMREH